MIGHSTRTPPGKTVFCFPIPVWGKYYVSQLLNYCVPSLLAKGNFPYLAEQGDVKIILTTTEEDKAEISRSPLLARLSKLAKITFDIVPAPTSTTMSHCHNQGFEQCKNGYVFFVLADHLLPENGLRTLHENLTADVEALQIIAPRVKHASLREPIENYRNDGVISISQEALNALSFAALDHTMYWRDVHGPFFTNWPSSLLQKNEKTTCMRFFHLHLIALKNREGLKIDDSITFDARFLAKIIPDPAKIRTLDDCRVFFMPSTVPDLFLCPTEPNHTDRPILNVGKTALVETADWARKQADHYEWNNFLNYKIILSTDRSEAASLLDEAMLNDISGMSKILNYFDNPTAEESDAHNKKGLTQPGIKYVLVDTLEPRTFFTALPSSVAPISVDGLTRLMDKAVEPVTRMKTADFPPRSVFLQMNSKSMLYLRKLLTLGVPATALFAATDVAALSSVYMQTPRAMRYEEERLARLAKEMATQAVFSKEKEKNYAETKIVRILHTETGKKLEFFFGGHKIAEVTRRHGLRLIKG